MAESKNRVDAFLTPSPSNSSGSCSESEELLVFKKRKVSNDESVLLCPICKQNILDPNTKFFQTPPESALEEEAALTDDRLLLYSDGELIPEIDIKPMHKITQFTVFDGEGHICPFDTGLIENDQLIFFSGYIKPIYADDPSPTNGVPAQELGPILEWWISGFDCGDSFIVGFSTPYAEYILMEPSPEYGPFMRFPKQKALLTKIVVEFLLNTNAATYEDLLNRINEVSVPEDIEALDERWLGKHAQFIVDQISELEDKKKLLSAPAIQHLVKLFGVNVEGTKKKRCRLRNTYRPTTTPLVYNKFRFFFENKNGFGASPEPKKKPEHKASPHSKQISKFSWEPGSDSAVVNDEVIFIKNFVFINAKPEKANRIFRIEYFFHQNFTKQVHCSELIRSTDTILGDAGDPREYFFLEECSNWPICKLMGTVEVAVKEPPKTWPEFTRYTPDSREEKFFVQKTYLQRHGIFEDLKEDEGRGCGVCSRREKREKFNTPVPHNGKVIESGVTDYEKVVWRGEEYSPGCCVYLEPFSVVFNSQKSSKRIEKTLVTLKTDEVIYPEIYRKAKEVSLTEECPEPFVIGYIKSIFSRSEGPQKKLYLTVNKFYRPENTRAFQPRDQRLLDLQLLYWSEEEAEVLFDHVHGKCDVICSENPPRAGLHAQFYFNAAFDAETETFTPTEGPPLNGVERESTEAEKLKTLNAFSGCGGLAEGLRQSGVAEIAWAVEMDASTCTAYRSNFPGVVQFEQDCNLFLKEVMYGKRFDGSGKRYPERGEVEFLCGGPPCQGFSLMNRYSSKEESQYNNSLILTFLSFCDYYRPKYFLLENVRNFVVFKKSIFLKHALSSLVAMGYQVNFGVLQAGNYGVPQNRRRLFILAAAPGLALPDFPKPTHVFYGSLKNFEYEVNGSNFVGRVSNVLSGSAPFRHVTIWDAMSDLPRTSDSSKFRSEETYYERFLRSGRSAVHDHVPKEMSALNEARIKHIPAAKGCDWRDLPNIRVRLRDGTVTNLLKYSHHDRKNGKSCCGLFRGVCGCASGKACTPKDRQSDTLIPWFLVHTANRNNNWSGLYGRLDWEGVFSTVTTNPEPSNHQGRVLHPEEDRTVSVRECARAQGLPDTFKLHGTVAEKFKQVGNAVPTPVARAFGREILHSLDPDRPRCT